MTSGFKLSEGTLKTIMNGGFVQEPVLQVLGSKKINSFVAAKEHHRLLLSDGRFTTNTAMLTIQFDDDNIYALLTHSVIKVKRYVANVIKLKDKRDSRIMLILDLELVAKGDVVGGVIGNPVSLNEHEIPTSQTFDMATLTGAVNPKTCHKDQVISPISSLSPFHNNWVIKARVTNKTSVRTWSNSRGEGKFFTLDLIDESGDIRCTVFRELVDKFFEQLEVDGVYYISKCQLKPSNKQFSATNHEFEMVFTVDTIIEDSLNDNDCIPPIKYNLTTIDKISLMEVETLVDVIAVCKSVSELQQFTSQKTNRELRKKDILLVDRSEAGISLTIWGDDAESFNHSDNPVILLTNAKITGFRSSKSLGIRPGTQLKLNPNVPEAAALRSWFQAQGNQIEFKNVSDRRGLNIPWMTFKEVQERDLSCSDKPFYYQTFGTILLVRLDRAVYKACPTPDCFKKVTDLENGLYRCDKCNREFPMFTYRLLVSMNVSDSSSSQWVTMFSSEAEKILGRTAQEIGVALENDSDSVTKVFEDAQFKQFVFKCRATMENYNDELKMKTIVVGVNPIKHDEYNKYLVEKIDKFRAMVCK